MEKDWNWGLVRQCLRFIKINGITDALEIYTHDSRYLLFVAEGMHRTETFKSVMKYLRPRDHRTFYLDLDIEDCS